MRRTLIGCAIGASLLLSACAGVPGPSSSPQERVAVSTPNPTRSAAVAGDSPDPALIVEVPQPVAAPGPVRAAIPEIGEVPVVAVGIGAEGQAEIPANVAQIGWYRYGSAPGDGDGSVVLMGHRDSKGGKGALYDLAAVPVGGTIELTDAAGTSYTYRVTSNDSIAKRVVPLSDLFVREGPPTLTIISCGGPYDRSQGGYLDNVVVRAERL